MPASPTATRSPAPHDAVAALATATDRLYQAFEAVPFDADMARWPSTVSEREVAALGAPVRTLPPALVARFLVKAGTTWGGPDDVRRVVPRALELAADHALPVDRGLLWAKLRWAGWPRWPTYQVVTVRAFLQAEWDRLLRTDPRPAHLAHRWLRDATGGLEDLSPLLDQWADALGPDTPPRHHRAVTGHLVLLLTNSPLRPDFPATVADVLPGRPDATAQLARWLADPRTDEQLQRAAMLLAGTTDSRRVRVAAERLRRFAVAHAAVADTEAATGSGD